MSREYVKPVIGPHSSPREIADHINRAFKTSDIREICQAIGDATRGSNLSGIARKAGIVRTSLYRAFAGGPNHPNFKTVLSVLDAMGLQLSVKARRGRRASRSARNQKLSKPE